MANELQLRMARMGTEVFSLWRRSNPSVEIDLSDARLIGASFHGADLRGGSFEGSDLSAADLRKADLRGANLSGAKLHGAFADDADFTGANLECAELNETTLRRAILREVNLREADLRGFRIVDEEGRAADITGADLSGVMVRDIDAGPLIGGYFELAAAVGLESASFDEEVADYLRQVTTWAGKSNNPDRLPNEVIDRIVANAMAALRHSGANG